MSKVEKHKESLNSTAGDVIAFRLEKAVIGSKIEWKFYCFN